MPRGDKSAYTDKQKRMAEHIEEGYESRGLSEKEAERRAWATVNATTHGGKKSGSGRGRAENHEPERQRKLLLHKGEIERLIGKTAEKGLTLIPLRIYFKGSRAKVELMTITFGELAEASSSEVRKAR